jgi:hypothetical protein
MRHDQTYARPLTGYSRIQENDKIAPDFDPLLHDAFCRQKRIVLISHLEARFIRVELHQF